MLFAGLGVGAMCFLMNYDYKKLEKHNKTFLWIVIGLLLILQFTPLGVTINGAKRWINLVVFQLQPSELAKPLFCMLLASLFKDKINLNTLLKNLWVVIPMALIILLILKQPNLSMAVILTITSIAVYIAARGPWAPILFGGGIIGVGILTKLPSLLHGYQRDRITAWLDPTSDALGKGYNIIHLATHGFFYPDKVAKEKDYFKQLHYFIRFSFSWISKCNTHLNSTVWTEVCKNN